MGKKYKERRFLYLSYFQKVIVLHRNSIVMFKQDLFVWINFCPTFFLVHLRIMEEWFKSKESEGFVQAPLKCKPSSAYKIYTEIYLFVELSQFSFLELDGSSWSQKIFLFYLT